MGEQERTLAAARAPDTAPSLDADSEVQRVFFAAVAGAGAEAAPDIEALCREHPRHASDLRLLHAHWKRARVLLGDGRGPGSSLGRYRVIGRIAEGGMGVVLSVWDPALARTLAMKMLPRPGPVDRESSLRMQARMRLEHEARILGRLQHPSIVPVHEVGVLEDDEPYFTMLNVRGLALSDILPKLASGADGWTLPRAIRVLLQVCEAVAHAHSQGILHRDLKPSNVMVGPFGETYVMDWGLARARDFAGEVDLRLTDPGRGTARVERKTEHATPLLTLDGDVIGTPGYMSPEQARGRIDEVGERSDVYSAGAMLYHVLAGRAPYASGASGASGAAGRGDTSPREVLERVLAGAPAPLAELAPRAPSELVSISERAMAREAADRYPTMLALAEDLSAWLEVRVVQAHARGAWAELKKWVRRNRGAAAAVLVGVSALLALSVFQAVARHRERLLDSERRAELYNAHVGLAAQALDKHEAPALREHLEACPEDLRGWEWRYLRREADTSDLVLTHEGQSTSSLAWSSDRRWLAAGTRNGPILVHEVGSGRSFTLAGHEAAVSPLAFTADGQRLCSGSPSGRIGVWDLRARTRERWIEVGAPVTALATSLDGRRLRVASPGPAEFELESGERTSWAPAVEVPVVSCTTDFTRAEQFRFPVPLGVLSLDFERLIVIRQESCALVDMETGVPLAARDVELVPFRSLIPSPDGHWIAVRADEGGVRLLELTGAQREVSLPTSFCWPMAWSPDSRLFLTSDGYAVDVWDAETGELAEGLMGHRNSIQVSALSADCRWLATSSGDGGLRLWDLEHAQRRRSVLVSKTQIRALAMRPDGGAVACVTLEGILEVRDVQTRARQHRFESSGALECLSWSPDGGRIATGGRDGRLRVWDLAAGRIVSEHAVLPRMLGWVAFLPDGRQVAHQPYFKGRIGLLDLESGATVWTLDRDYGPADITVDGTTIAAVDPEGIVRVFDALGGTERSSWPSGLPLLGEPQSLVLSPDGELVSLTQTWARGTCLHSIDGELLGSSLAFDGDRFLGGERLISLARGLCIVDPYTVRSIAVLPGPMGECAIARDIVVMASVGKLVWWSAAPWEKSSP